MACIYKIVNKTNGKIYVGATTRDLEERKREHINSYNNKKCKQYNSKLYSAIRKHNIDNFEFVLIENCTLDKMCEKESYYIKKYDSIKNGYNIALGGKGKPLITEKKIEAFKVLYENGWMLQDIEEVFGNNRKTIGKKLRQKYNISTNENSNKSFSKTLIAYSDGLKLEFSNLKQAAMYVIENKLSNSKNIATISSKISGSVNKKTKAYGLNWKHKNAS